MHGSRWSAELICHGRVNRRESARPEGSFLVRGYFVDRVGLGWSYFRTATFSKLPLTIGVASSPSQSSTMVV